MNPLILYNNLFATGTLTGSPVASGYDIQNVRDYRPYTFAKFAAPGSNYIEINLGSSYNVDSAAICGHNLNSVGATVKVQKYTSSWNDLATYVPGSDDAFFVHFNLTSGTRFRILITNTIGQPYVGVAFLGEALEMPYPPDGPRSSYRKTIVADSEQSKTGYPLGTVIRYMQYDIEHRFSLIQKSFVDNYFKAFEEYASQLKPFFYAVDLDNEPDEIFYCVLNKNNAIEYPRSTLNYIDSINLSMTGTK